MSYFTSADEAQLSQEVVATTLAAALREHGAQKAFAAKTGITPVYINNIIKQRQMPRPKMARRLAEFLPLAIAERTAWLNQVELHWQARKRTLQIAALLSPDEFAGVVQQASACRHATFSLNPEEVHKNWSTVLHVGESAIAQRPNELNALHYMELCDSIYEAYTFAERHVAALWVAKRKQAAVALVENNDLIRRNSHLDLNLQHVNAMRLEMVSLTNMGLAREAYQLSRVIRADEVFKKCGEYWTPILTWDTLIAMADISRSSIRQARQMTYAAWRFTEQQADDWQQLGHMLIGRAFAQVCINQGYLDEAEHILGPYLASLRQIPLIGTFHQILLLRTWARLRWHQRQLDDWQQSICQAVRLADEAGVYQELSEIQREYGQAVITMALGTHAGSISK